MTNIKLVEIPEDEAIRHGYGIYEYKGELYKFVRCNIENKTLVCNWLRKV